jgi:hypothetical protein
MGPIQSSLSLELLLGFLGRRNLQHMPVRMIGAGLGPTGTMSLKLALEEL